MKIAKIMLVLAIAFALGTAAYAETQSVKVSGAITERTIARQNYDLSTGDYNGKGTGQTATTDWDTHLMSQAEVQIDADLTDNVAGVIRLVNQRVWGNNAYNSTGDLELNGVAPTTQGQFDVIVDLAYIELKEFLYSPLTLKIGRQDITFGNGFIIGAAPQDPTAALFAPEYSAITSYDAIRATLDYDPWTIDALYAKIDENMRRADDDVNLWGINVGYVFDDYNAEMEGYWFYNNDRRSGATNAGTNKYINDTHTLGLRGSFDPIEDWTVGLEGAYQLGEYLNNTTPTTQSTVRDRSAWAIDAMLEIRTFQDDYAWRPVVGVEYIYYSGQKDVLDETNGTTGDFNGWNRMYRGKFDTAIREFQGNTYTTQYANDTAGDTNQHQVLLRGTVEPTDSLTLNATYAHFWMAEKPTSRAGNKNIGDEVNLQAIWDYTEDVSFGLLSAWFFPGSTYPDNQDAIATDIVGTVALSF
ncbi:MAG: alginate export family protein [Candidatus Omnitrophica bacterium]|nr:alginate export family protein [Candidatus Omnitrophota bacterium]